jgi:hypothetical protein
MRFRIRRPLLAALNVGLLLALVSSAAVVVLDAGPARAACSLTGCHGKWPQNEGCHTGTVLIESTPVHWDDQQAQNPTVYGDGTMLIRYSPACRAAFAEFNMRTAVSEFFYPVFWVQPQHGGRMTAMMPAENDRGFRMVSGDGVPGNDNREVFYSMMASWEVSVRVCVGDFEMLDYEPDRPSPPSSPYKLCGVWQ